MDLKYKSGDRVILINPEPHWSREFKAAAENSTPITLTTRYTDQYGWSMLNSWMSEDHLKLVKPRIIIIGD